jgi:hypothetical protein
MIYGLSMRWGSGQKFIPEAAAYSVICLCLLLLHSPDGSELWIESNAITVIKSGVPHRDHIAKGIGTVVYTAKGNFGIREADGDVAKMIKSCDTLSK